MGFARIVGYVCPRFVASSSSPANWRMRQRSHRWLISAILWLGLPTTPPLFGQSAYLPQEMRFSGSCIIENTMQCGGQVCVLVRNIRNGNRQIVTWANRHMYLWSGVDGLWDMCGMGIDDSGGLFV